ncbi:MAG: hypothetical protein QXQ39_03215 [Conexivisphaerales archaeon]
MQLLKRSRLLADIDTMEKAERVETTIKTGYSEPILENIIQWIAVEEDLASSYEKMSSSLSSEESKKLAKKLAQDSKDIIQKLEELRSEFAIIDERQTERINEVMMHSK